MTVSGAAERLGYTKRKCLAVLWLYAWTKNQGAALLRRAHVLHICFLIKLVWENFFFSLAKKVQEKIISHDKSKCIYNSNLKGLCFWKMQLLWHEWRTDLKDLRSEAESSRDLLRISYKVIQNPKSGQWKERWIRNIIACHFRSLSDRIWWSACWSWGKRKRKEKVTEIIDVVIWVERKCNN